MHRRPPNRKHIGLIPLVLLSIAIPLGSVAGAAGFGQLPKLSISGEIGAYYGSDGRRLGGVYGEGLLGEDARAMLKGWLLTQDIFQYALILEADHSNALGDDPADSLYHLERLQLEFLPGHWWRFGLYGGVANRTRQYALYLPQTGWGDIESESWSTAMWGANFYLVSKPRNGFKFPQTTILYDESADNVIYESRDASNAVRRRSISLRMAQDIGAKPGAWGANGGGPGPIHRVNLNYDIRSSRIPGADLGTDIHGLSLRTYHELSTQTTLINTATASFVQSRGGGSSWSDSTELASDVRYALDNDDDLTGTYRIGFASIGSGQRSISNSLGGLWSHRSTRMGYGTRLGANFAQAMTGTSEPDGPYFHLAESLRAGADYSVGNDLLSVGASYDGSVGASQVLRIGSGMIQTHAGNLPISVTAMTYLPLNLNPYVNYLRDTSPFGATRYQRGLLFAAETYAFSWGAAAISSQVYFRSGVSRTDERRAGGSLRTDALTLTPGGIVLAPEVYSQFGASYTFGRSKFDGQQVRSHTVGGNWRFSPLGGLSVMSAVDWHRREGVQVARDEWTQVTSDLSYRFRAMLFQASGWYDTLRRSATYDDWGFYLKLTRYFGMGLNGLF